MPTKLNKYGEIALSEDEEASRIADWLRWQGWHCIRTDVIRTQSDRGFISTGVIGQADCIFVRPISSGHVDFFYAELKKRDAKTQAKRAVKQAQFAQEMTQRGYLCYRAPDDKTDKLNHFKNWYACNW